MKLIKYIAMIKAIVFKVIDGLLWALFENVSFSLIFPFFLLWSSVAYDVIKVIAQTLVLGTYLLTATKEAHPY